MLSRYIDRNYFRSPITCGNSLITSTDWNSKKEKTEKLTNMSLSECTARKKNTPNSISLQNCQDRSTSTLSHHFDVPMIILVVLKVETWLNTLLKSMQSTVRKTLEESVVSYEEKPRDQWLFDYPAQIALTGSQIWWTTEVSRLRLNCVDITRAYHAKSKSGRNSNSLYHQIQRKYVSVAVN